MLAEGSCCVGGVVVVYLFGAVVDVDVTAAYLPAASPCEFSGIRPYRVGTMPPAVSHPTGGPCVFSLCHAGRVRCPEIGR